MLLPLLKRQAKGLDHLPIRRLSMQEGAGDWLPDDVAASPPEQGNERLVAVDDGPLGQNNVSNHEAFACESGSHWNAGTVLVIHHALIQVCA